MAAKSDFKNMIRALQDPSFTPLAEDAIRNYVSWEEIAEREPLPGLSTEETWGLLALVRRLNRFAFPIPTVSGIDYWYNITRDGQHLLEYIRHHCREDSVMHTMLHEREGHRFLVRAQIQEAVASCRLDGVILDQGIMGRMLKESRTPKDSSERLVLNMYEMLSELERHLDEPFTAELAYALYERLLRDVNVSELERGERKTNLAGTRNTEGLLDADSQRERLERICEYANLKTGDPDEPAACRGYMILSAMAYWHPLPDFNDTVGRFMMRLFALKRGFPALAYIPTSLMMQRWFDGELPAGTVRFDTYRRRQVLPSEIDGTADMLIYLELTSAAIAALRNYIDITLRQEAELLGRLDRGERLNYRQRSVLSRALVQPDAEFRIAEHQKTHKVVYQTARADLLDLVERGYLHMEQRGKAFVFVPVSDLQRRIAENGTGAS